MSQLGEGAPTLALAIARFKQGKCPCCGKGAGEPRGMEYRDKSEDLYCHTCKRRWPLELDIVALQMEFASLEPVRKVATGRAVPAATVAAGPEVERRRSLPRRLVGFIRQNILGR